MGRRGGGKRAAVAAAAAAAAAQTDHLAARSVFLKGEEEELAKKHALLGFALTQLQKTTHPPPEKRKKGEKIRDGDCDRDVERRRRENGLPKFAHLCFERPKCFLMNFPPVSKGRRFSNLGVTLMEP